MTAVGQALREARRGIRVDRAQPDEIADVHRAVRGAGVLFVRRAELSVGRQSHPHVETCRAERLSRDRHDLRDRDRRHRPFRRIDRRPVRDGRRRIDPQWARPSHRLHRLFQRRRSHRHHALRRPGDRRDQRRVDHASSMSRRSSRRSARSMSPEASRCCLRTARRFRTSSARRNSERPATACLAPAGCSAFPSVIWILVGVALAAAYLARFTPLGRHIFAVGGNERAARSVGHPRRRGSRCSSTCSPDSARRSSASSSRPN